MTTFTADQQLALPSGTDNANGPGAFTAFAGSMEDRLVKIYASVAERSARNAAPTDGELAFLSDVRRWDYYDGVRGLWRRLLPHVYATRNISGSNLASNFNVETLLYTKTFAAGTLEPDAVYEVEARATAFTGSGVTQPVLRIKAGGTQFAEAHDHIPSAGAYVTLTARNFYVTGSTTPTSAVTFDVYAAVLSGGNIDIPAPTNNGFTFKVTRTAPNSAQDWL